MSPKRARLHWTLGVGTVVGFALFGLGWIVAYDSAVSVVYRARQSYIQGCLLNDEQQAECEARWLRAIASPRP